MKEKISLIYFLGPAIDRLGIKAYDHGDECLHGLVRPGNATVFPQAIGLGATFDPALVHEMTTAISDEARAKWNQAGGNHMGSVQRPADGLVSRCEHGARSALGPHPGDLWRGTRG